MAAAWEDEALAAHMLPAAFVPFPCPHPFPPATKDGWRLSGGGCRPAASPPAFPGFGQLTAAEYLENYRRAQLLAWLSRGPPGWAPRAPRAPRCHAAVQVNPRRDAAVQCSLGRRTLPRRDAEPRPAGFPRGVSTYSPVLFRRLAALLDAEREPASASSRDPGDPAGDATPRPRAEEDGDQDRRTPPPPKGDQGTAAQPSPEDRGEVAASTDGTSRPSTERDQERLSFQFLEQKYGYYHCKVCNIRWESAYVWCVQGTNKVYFKQFCRTCQKSYNPYRVEEITCQSCKRNICSCPVRLRHVDPKRPHRQDLCGRCKGKRLSCDSTFSFKYLI